MGADYRRRGRGLAEQRQPAPPGQRVHAALDGPLDLLVLPLDVVVVLRQLRVVVELDRILEGGPDLGGEGDLGQRRQAYAPRCLQRDREALETRDLIELERLGQPAAR